MSAIRLFLDEDVWPGLAPLLRERGFDVAHAYEVEAAECLMLTNWLTVPRKGVLS
jgi:hypothetical protein